jgi:hypothetical protein
MSAIRLEPLYQTIQNKGTNDSIERMGPIYGRDNTWLGPGYYFWEGAIELAHWWGRVHCKSDYIICEATAEFNQSEMFDLFGNTSDFKLFRDITNALKDKFAYQEITVSAVLNEMRKRTSFHYKVIRARSEHHIPGGEKMRFVERDTNVLITLPAVQVCFTDTKSVKNYHVIYPQPMNGQEFV